MPIQTSRKDNLKDTIKGNVEVPWTSIGFKKSPLSLGQTSGVKRYLKFSEHQPCPSIRFLRLVALYQCLHDQCTQNGTPFDQHFLFLFRETEVRSKEVSLNVS